MSAEDIVGKKFAEAKARLKQKEDEFQKELRYKLQEIQSKAIDKLSKAIS